ncbi:prolyl 4-hydroxylase subunit alpha-1-like [Branchiostoma lanceolatum]|uniref:prolyl 4-hydroxylase subunit alpha-1-like n=1 Tax=Branchiostoma lanceolatum TaxID=7740 RepID=UPI003454D655
MPQKKGKATKRKPETTEKARAEKDDNKHEKMAEKKPRSQATEKTNDVQETQKEEDLYSTKQDFGLVVLVFVILLLALGVLFMCFTSSESAKSSAAKSKTADDVIPGTKEAVQKCTGKTGAPKADMLEEEIEELGKSGQATKEDKEEEKVPSAKTDPKEAPKKPTKSSPKQKKPQPISEENRLPEEIKEFQPTILDRLKVRNVSVDGRQLRYRELKPTKDVDTNVRVYLFDNFLTARECEGLMSAHSRHVQEASKHDPIICFDSIKTLRNHLKDAGVKVKVSSQDFTEGTKCLNGSFSSQLKQHFHWSYSTSFYPGESKFSATFERRVATATGLKPENGGKFQITSYAQGIGYKSHTDCVVGSRDKRDRFATILVYLQDVPKGGETKFTELGIAVTPTKGMAIVWNNMTHDGSCDPTSLHDASKVRKGHKFIIQRWYYYKSFYSLGKRSPEPTLPARESGQPRVSCDEYEHGSCRWYDEWNYDHIEEYEAQKLNLA